MPPASPPTPPPSALEAAHPVGHVRQTIGAPVTVGGLGLFTGVRTTVVIRPATDVPGLSGIVFRRTDLPEQPTVEAAIGNVVSEQRRTVLQTTPTPGRPTARVETVEHILSALAGFGITDALIDLNGSEIPIGDGSALPFVQELRNAGLQPIISRLAPSPVRISSPLTVGEKGAQVDAFPLANPSVLGTELVYRLDYGPGSPIPPQEASIFLPLGSDAGAYVAEIAPARTFSTLVEAQMMRKMGLFTQFEPKDLLVFGPDGPIDNSVRFPNEPARHKVLDMLGDLSLAGRPVIGRIVATRSGHALNHEMARALASLP